MQLSLARQLLGPVTNISCVCSHIVRPGQDSHPLLLGRERIQKAPQAMICFGIIALNLIFHVCLTLP